MKRIILISLFLQLVILKGLVAQPYTVSGKVYYSLDGMTQIGIEGVRVYSEAPYVVESFTDAGGNYSFTNLPSSTLMTMHAEKTGYTFTPPTIERLVNQNYTNLNYEGTMVATVPVTFYYDAGNGNPTDVYLAGSMNGYNASDPLYKLSNDGNGIFTITKNFDTNDYVYKYVVDGNWVTDPYNPVTDGGQYNNSKLSVSEPMITYFLPAFNESFSSTSLPLIKVIVATADNTISQDSYTLTINSIPVTGTPTLRNGNKVLIYTPATSELNEGSNTCVVSFTASGETVTKTIQFQYSTQSGGSVFSVSGRVLDATKLPIEGVKISNGTAEVYSDGSGLYSLSGCNSTMTITSSKSGWNFVPDKISLSSYNSDVTDADFIATEGGGSGSETEKIQYTISGKVTACGNPIVGAEIESRGKKVYTASDGSYSFSDSVETNGTFYDPSSVIVNLNSEIFAGETSRQLYFSGTYVFTDVNFSGVYAEDSITGIISYPSGMAYSEKPLKWEIYQGEKLGNSTPLYDTIIFTNTVGEYSAPYFYYPKGMGGAYDYYTFRITLNQKGYSSNPVVVGSYQSCQSIKNKNMEIAFDAVPICMVTVSEDNHNTVVWEKPETDDIEGFAIYKETNVANEYLPIDTLAYTEIAMFIDTESDPSAKAYRYKLSTILKQDYSVLNDAYHKTIHLTINKGTGNSWNLIWSHYEGLEISTYKLFRGETKETMTFLTDIAGNLNSYTDNTAPIGNMYYQIEMVLEDACNPEVAKPLLKSTKAGSIYSSTKSNIANSANPSTDINKIIEDKNFIYPNPVENTLYFKNSKALNEFEIYSIQGALIKQGVLNTSIDVSNLQSGLYHIRVKNDEKWESFRFIKE